MRFAVCNSLSRFFEQRGVGFGVYGLLKSSDLAVLVDSQLCRYDA